MSKLSYDKFAKLLSEHKYLCPHIYYIHEENRKNAVFFEVRLPHTQKSVLVYVPSKYTLHLPSSVSAKIIEIVSASEKLLPITSKSVDYLLNARGPLIEDDLTVLSSEGICRSKFNGDTVCYFMASNIPKTDDIIEDPGISESIEDEADLLRKEVDTLAKTSGVTIEHIDIEAPIKNIPQEDKSKDKLPKEDNLPKEDKPSKEDIENPIPEEGNRIELEFQESEESTEKTSDFSDESSEEVKPVKKRKNKKIKKPIPPITLRPEKLKVAHRTNYIIPEELDVYLGIVYVTVDINIFYKNIATYETQALSIYEQLEDNEKDMRQARVTEIKKRLSTLNEHIELRVNTIETEEKTLKYQLLKLTSVLKTAEEMKSKIPINKKETINIDAVYNKTRKTIHEINVKLLQKRDEVEDLLINYEEGTKELFDL